MNDRQTELKEHSAHIFEMGGMEQRVYLKNDADAETDIAMSQRWRKCSEELPQNGQDVWAYDSKSKSVLHLEYEKSDEGEGFIVFPYKHDFLQNITQWMPFEKPKAPEDTEK